MKQNIIIIGAGLWACVMAERITSRYHLPVRIIEKNDVAGGACHSAINSETDIEYHQHGTHIFHTSFKNVWDYIKRFSDFNRYHHKVLTTHNQHVYSMPINLGTINDFYGRNFTPREAEELLKEEIKRNHIGKPRNLEEKAISLIGRPLYEAFIKFYTQKQWECDPKDLPTDIINRLPVRFNYNTDYFNDYWQGLPKDGYFSIFKNLLASPLITVQYNTDFFAIRNQLPNNTLIIYTGLPDMLFDYKFGELEWRSLRFEWEYLDVQDFQGTSVMNYADADVPYTRIHEFKHLHPERAEAFNCNKTIICREYPKKWKLGDPAYYPINNRENNERYELYRREAEKAGIILGGRLGKYKYFDMDQCINDALQTFDNELPKFLNQ